MSTYENTLRFCTPKQILHAVSLALQVLLGPEALH